MNEMSVPTFLSTFSACLEGREYAMEFDSMYDVYESLLAGREAGIQSFKWAWWILTREPRAADKDMDPIILKMKDYLYDVLRPILGDEYVDGVKSKKISPSGGAGFNTSTTGAEHYALESMRDGAVGFDYLQGVHCFTSLYHARLAQLKGPPDSEGTLSTGYTGLIMEVQEPFLTKLRELGNPFRKEEV